MDVRNSYRKVIVVVRYAYAWRRHPHYLYFFSLSFSLFIVVKEASLLWRAKFSVGSSYEVLDVNTFIFI